MIAIDQSYDRSGFAVAEPDALLYVDSLAVGKFPTKAAKRIAIRLVTRHLVLQYKPDVVIVERVRLASQGYVSMAAILALGGIVASICDAVYPHDVYSVDTRNWKSKVIGHGNASKEDAVEFVKRGWDWDVDHDAADAACMALSAFKDGVKLRQETK